MAINPIYHQTNEKLQQELIWIEETKKNPERFEPLYRKYHEQIFRYIYQRMDDKELAFDLTSQVFLKAIKNIKKYEYRGVPFASWLYRIAKSELYQSFRDKKSRRTVNLETYHLHDLVDEFDDKEEKELKKKVLLESISEMKEEDVQILEMRFFEKRSFKEIGEILDITENNAKVKSYRIVEKLRKVYYKKENNYIGHGKTQD